MAETIFIVSAPCKRHLYNENSLNHETLHEVQSMIDFDCKSILLKFKSCGNFRSKVLKRPRCRCVEGNVTLDEVYSKEDFLNEWFSPRLGHSYSEF